MNKPYVKLVLCSMALIFPGMIGAANSDNPIDGRLNAVYSDFITLTIPSQVTKSPDVNKFDTGELAIQVDSQTGYENFDQLK